ncbi:MAG TPA: hypothetical protein VJ483_00495 [Holophagaceae bacterium]|nr:hypothetical protein [Holophagaceae bacterium]
MEIPGAGGGWTLLAVEGLRFDGETADLGGAFGRGGIRRLGDVVIRPYRRGGMVRHVNDRTYPSQRRFIQELEIHRRLHAAGFPTVEPLGCAWRRHRWGVEGLYFSRFDPATPWPRAWDRSGEVLPALRQALDALAAWGLHAPDLNATNVLLPSAGGIVLLDWDRAAFRKSVGLAAAYAARLGRSLARLGAPEGILSQLR